MIDAAIKIHDKYQIEIKLKYQFENKRRATSYKIEYYIFIPNNLGIHYSTYKKNDFYGDIQNYIRFKTPVYLLNKIADDRDSPLARLKNTCEGLVRNPNDRSRGEYEYQIKMFSCIVKSSLRDHVNFITSKTNSEEIVTLMETYVHSLKSISAEYRKLKRIINVPNLGKDIYSTFLFGDEYISLLIEKYNFKLLEYLKTSVIPSADTLNRQLLDMVRQEVTYRRNNGYDSIPSEDSDNEVLIFRYSVLKKYLESVLSIDTSKKPEGLLLEQFILSLAAGLAMVFATAAAFWGHFVYGSYSLPVFFTLIISYMFKDRIKELTRMFFTSKILRLLHDHRIKIFMGTRKIGVFRESFNFIKRNTIPKSIMKIRNLHRTKEFDNKFSKERIILYQKKIELYSKVFKKKYFDYPISGINGIFRLNISRFLHKMDNPDKPIFLLTSDGYTKSMAKRVYHLNMIIKYSDFDHNYYARYRIVLTRHGIKRLEEIATFDSDGF